MQASGQIVQEMMNLASSWKHEVPESDMQKIEIDKDKPRTKEIRVFADEGTRGEMMLLKGKAGMFKSSHVGQVEWPPLDFLARRIIVVKWV